MIELARRAGGDPPRRDDARFEQLEVRIVARHFERQRERRVWISSLAAAACLALGVAGWSFYTPALTYTVVNGAEVEGRVVGKAGTKVRFSDGSEVAIQSGAEARVGDVSAHGGRVRLGHGQVSLSITKRPDAAWFVDAGPYTVRVTGTAFDVSWSQAEQLFEVNLHHGSVVVTGPQIGSGFALRPGQRLIGRHGGHVLVEGPRPAPVAAAADVAANTPPALDGASGALAAAGSSVTPEVSGDVRRADSAATPTTWAKLVAQGKFRAVIEDAKRRGIEQTLVAASIEDLSALADAARYESSRDLARRALLAERQRFPRSSAAREAAFLLGRLAEERGEGALEWYDRYLAESPRGPYAAQALGRRMMIYYRERGQADAAPLAREYLQRFPKGAYVSAARKIVDQPSQ
jgi:TolA-binding protein